MLNTPIVVGVAVKDITARDGSKIPLATFHEMYAWLVKQLGESNDGDEAAVYFNNYIGVPEDCLALRDHVYTTTLRWGGALTIEYTADKATAPDGAHSKPGRVLVFYSAGGNSDETRDNPESAEKPALLFSNGSSLNGSETAFTNTTSSGTKIVDPDGTTIFAVGYTPRADNPTPFTTTGQAFAFSNGSLKAWAASSGCL
ncbi:hypothetical protein [Calidifontibacter terrae]